MHKILLDRPNVRNYPNDALSYYAAQERRDLFVLHTEESLDSYDTTIYSIHAPNAPMKTHARVAVISFVPKMDSKHWPDFYLNLCNAQIIACDSFVKKQLDELSYPPKRWINLDGAIVELDPNRREAGNGANPVIKCLEPLGKIWKKYSTWLDADEEVNIIGLKSTFTTYNADILISFEDHGFLLTNTLAKAFPFVWFTRNDDVYLDGRHTHVVSAKLKHIMELSGQAVEKVVADSFIEMTEELIGLFVHSKTTTIPVFRSNVTIVDRIFNELMKS